MARGTTMLPLWTLIDYMQLASFLPLFNFNFIPYMYDALKPFLVSHCVFTDDVYVPIFKEFEGDYFNDNWKKYWLSVGKLGQALYCIILVGFALIGINVVVAIAWFITPRGSK